MTNTECQVILLENFKGELIRSTPHSVALDLTAGIDEPIIIGPNSVSQKIGFGIKIYFGTAGTFGLIASRSGLGSKGINIRNGVGIIDPDYQGELSTVIENTSNEPFTINPGDRIAQLIFMRYELPTLNFVENFSEKSIRGEGGFGSSGTNNNTYKLNNS